jgi:peptide/nickel transport system substrate-binding protein
MRISAVALLALALSAASPALAADDASLAIGIASEPNATLDALVRDDGQRDIFTMNVYETLTRLDADGNIVPLLATEWHNDGNDWIFTIREGVKFHNGQELTPADVVASYERAINPDLNPDTTYLSGVLSVTQEGEHDVRIKTAAFDPAVPTRAKHVIIVPADWADPADHRLDTEMMGTGPYRFVAWNRGQDIEMERFDGYWGDKPSVAKVDWRIMPDAAVRLAALQAGEIQIAYGMSGDLADSAPKVVSGPFSEVMIMRPNALYGPLMDADLRHAVNIAIDRQTICDALYGGYCTMTQGQPIIPQVLGYNPDLQEYPYDPDGARKILEEKNAVGTVLTLAVPTDRWAKGRELGQAVAAQLEAVGFKVDAQYEEIGQWIVQHRAVVTDPSGAADLSLYGTSNEMFDSVFSYDQALSCGGPTSAFCDKDIDAAGLAARAIADPAERAKAYQAVWKMYHDAYASVPFFSLQQVHFVAPNIDWQPSPQVHLFVKDVTVN